MRIAGDAAWHHGDGRGGQASCRPLDPGAGYLPRLGTVHVVESTAARHQNHNRYRRRADHASPDLSRSWRRRAVHLLLLASASSDRARVAARGATPVCGDPVARLPAGKNVGRVLYLELPPCRSWRMTMTATIALQFAGICAALGMVMRTAESLWHWRQGNFGETGVWPWYILRTDHSSLAAAALTPALDGTGLLALLLARFGAAALTPVFYWSGLNAGLLLLILILSQFLLTFRCRYGGEGGDQMTTIMLIMALVPQAAPNEPALATLA